MPSENRVVFDKDGYSSIIYRHSDQRKVCKSFLPEFTEHHFPVEVEAYERFTAQGSPPTIPKYYGLDEDDPAGIVLELAEKGNLMKYLWDNTHRYNNPPSQDLFFRWARQAAEALMFAHSCGVLHSDIHCLNFLLDENLDLKVADWAGASIDGGKSWSFYRTTHQLPSNSERKAKETTIETEIFALGCAFYCMVTAGHDVFPELHFNRDKKEIKRRLREKEFPNTDELKVLGSVIERCWNLEYGSMKDVIKAIDAEKFGFDSRTQEEKSRD